MTPGIEHLRTPLSDALRLDKQIQGTISGFHMPKFVVDLPGGGGKRLVSTYETYDKRTGVSTWTAPGLGGDKGKATYYYHDALPLDFKEPLDPFPMFRAKKGAAKLAKRL
jgi:lysine 2,3-aminomutase